MFEIGKKYDVTMLEWGDDGPGPVQMFGRLVTEIDGALVKFVSPATEMDLPGGKVNYPETHLIVNTQSLYFVSAKPSQ